jgi:hypothetical protein
VRQGLALHVSARATTSAHFWWRPWGVCLMSIRIQCLCIDAHDPGKIAAFWADALGWRRTFDEPDQVCLEPPAGRPEDGVAPDLLFLRVPEGS